MTKHKKSKHGGPRPGAGAPLKDESAGPRKMWSGRLAQSTIKALQKNAKGGLSQAGIIDQAVAQWSPSRQRQKIAEGLRQSAEGKVVDLGSFQ
jgi:predicted transcriptional regulator